MSLSAVCALTLLCVLGLIRVRKRLKGPVARFLFVLASVSVLLGAAFATQRVITYAQASAQAQRLAIGPVELVTNDYVLPASDTLLEIEQGATIIVARESVRAGESIEGANAADRQEHRAPSPLPEGLVNQLQAVWESGSLEPTVLVVADQLTDYATLGLILQLAARTGWSRQSLVVRNQELVYAQGARIEVNWAEAFEDDDEAGVFHLHVGHAGFELTSGGEVLEAITGCPPVGPTICRSPAPETLRSTFDQARHLFLDERTLEGEAQTLSLLASYDLHNLYNLARALKADHPHPSVVRLSADPSVPLAVITRTLDALRFVREQDRYADGASFRAARIRQQDGQSMVLFDEAVLTFAR